MAGTERKVNFAGAASTASPRRRRADAAAAAAPASSTGHPSGDVAAPPSVADWKPVQAPKPLTPSTAFRNSVSSTMQELRMSGTEPAPPAGPRHARRGPTGQWQKWDLSLPTQCIHSRWCAGRSSRSSTQLAGSPAASARAVVAHGVVVFVAVVVVVVVVLSGAARLRH